MNIHIFQFNMFGVNTYLLWDSETRECAIVDPGMITPDEEQKIDSFILDHNLRPTYLINTHLHIDHTFGNDHVAENYQLLTNANRDDEFLGAQRAAQARMFGLSSNLGVLRIGNELKDGDVLRLGHSTLHVISVPGHSPGSIALYSPEGKFVITGDALFAGGIGRTDLPGGDYPQLIKSITNRLLTLPGDTIVYPGHGGSSTIAREKEINPYL